MDSFIAKFKTPISELWANNKIFLVFCGVFIVLIKFHGVIFDLLVAGSKKKVEEAQNKSNVLKNEESVLNAQGDRLLEEAKSLDSNKTEITEDWHKK